MKAARGEAVAVRRQGAAERAGRASAWLVPAAVALLALAVFRATMLPGVGAWDTAEAQVVPPILGTMHPTGFPAYVVLGWLVSTLLSPFAAPATNMNFLSGLLVATAVATSVPVSRRLGAPPIVAGAVAIAFALTPIVWTIALSADAHALHLVLVVLVTLGLLRWEDRVRAWRATPDGVGLRRSADRTIVLTAGVFGVAVANHALSLLLVPAIGLFVLATDPRVLRRPGLVAAAIGVCLGVAALLYLQLPLRAGLFRAPLVYGSPDTWDGFWEIVLARQFQNDIIGPLQDWPGKLASLYELASAQFGVLLPIMVVAFPVVAVRFPRYALFSLVAVVVTAFFAASYANARIDRYYLGPTFFAWTWIAAFAGVVANRILGAGQADEADEALEAGSPGPVPADPRQWPAALLVPVVLGAALLVPTATQVRDRWAAVDVSKVVWVQGWLDEAFSAMEEDAVVVSWWSFSTPMWYGQHAEGRRPDIWIVDDRTRIDEDLGEIEDVIEANLGRRPVYLVRQAESDIERLRARYAIEPAGRPGNLFRVTGRQESTS